MRVRVLFFASLKDDVGEDALTLQVNESGGMDALFEALATRISATGVAVLHAENVRLAVNQQLITPPLKLRADDEVAFLPPVTGG
ncbi:MAG: MoaD/ThiS family protein [Pseudomonadales bacterium]|jgi:molybdopterin synthase sulfur carrier subunit